MDYLYIFVSIVLISLGILGVFIAILPGPILVLAGIFVYGWGTGFTIISLKVIIIFSILTLIAIASDYFTSFIAAKRLNISKKALFGMLIGGIVGFILFNVIGLIAGQFIGAFLGEIVEEKKLLGALKAGGAAIIGYTFGMIINLSVVIIMVSYFIYILYRGGGI